MGVIFLQATKEEAIIEMIPLFITRDHFDRKLQNFFLLSIHCNIFVLI